MHDESGIAWDVETRDDGTRSLRVAAQPGRRYTIEQSADLEEWSPVRSWLGLTAGQVVSTDLFVGPPPPGAPVGQGQPVSPPGDLPKVVMLFLQPVEGGSAVLNWCRSGENPGGARLHVAGTPGSWGEPTLVAMHVLDWPGWTVMLQSTDLEWKADSPSMPPENPPLSTDDAEVMALLTGHQSAIAAAIQAIHETQQAALQEARLHGLPAGPSAQGRYFRVREDSGIDSDGDGLTDEQELALGLNIFSGDTDGDGMDDHYEVIHGFDARDDADASADPDGDGDTNLAEYMAGTDPRVPDADHDGLPDAWEQAWASLVLATIDPNDPPAHIDTAMLAALQSGNLDPEADYTNDGLTTRDQQRATPDPLNAPDTPNGWAMRTKSFDDCGAALTLDTRWGRHDILGSSRGVRWFDALSLPGHASIDSGLAALQGTFEPTDSWVNQTFAQQVSKEVLGKWSQASAAPEATASCQITVLAENLVRLHFRKTQTWAKAWRPLPLPVDEVRRVLRIRSSRPAWSFDPWQNESSETVEFTIPAGRTTSAWLCLGEAADMVADGLDKRDQLTRPTLVADTDRDGQINATADEPGKNAFTKARGAVYVVNYDHDEGRTYVDDKGRANYAEDAVKWKGHKEDDLDAFGIPLRSLMPLGEEWHVDPANTGDLEDLTRIDLKPAPGLAAGHRVFLKVRPDQLNDARAFHLYIGRYTSGPNGETLTGLTPLWGGLDVDKKAADVIPAVIIGPEVEITKWVNPAAAGYEETRAVAGEQSCYRLFIEGIIFRGMPFPRTSEQQPYRGYAFYNDPQCPIFDGDIDIGVEVREGNTPATSTDWIKLSHCAPLPAEPVLAFDGHDYIHKAQGFGKFARGGRYGHVYAVTHNGDNKDNPDPQSLRYAIESPVPRTIIFALPAGSEGTFELSADLKVDDRYLTIAGQTAFRNGAAGICLKKAPLIIQTPEVIVRYIRCRPGEDAGPGDDAVTVQRNSSNVIIDHVSTSFSHDCLIDVSGSDKESTPGRQITVQNSIMTWPLDHNKHREDENGKITIKTEFPIQDHGYGSMISAGWGAGITFWRNLYAHCRARCPKVGRWQTSEKDPIGPQVDFVNNVIYGWGEKGGESLAHCGHAGYDGGPPGPNKMDTRGLARYNFIANYYLTRLPCDVGQRFFFQANNKFARAWFTGNRLKRCAENAWTPGDQYDEDVIDYQNECTPAAFRSGGFYVGGAFEVVGEPLEGGALLLSVCRNAGACLKRDGIDTLLLGADGAGGQLATKAGTIIDSPDEIGSWPLLPATVPPADLDHDGIPDDKEPPQAHAWDRPWKSDQRNALLDDNGNGQTNLDEYLANLVQDLSPSDNP